MEQGAGGAGCSALVHGGPQGQYARIATPAGPGESREDVCALKCPSRPTMLHMGRIKDHKSSLAGEAEAAADRSRRGSGRAQSCLRGRRPQAAGSSPFAPSGIAVDRLDFTFHDPGWESAHFSPR